jgi:hypothetical protein
MDLVRLSSSTFWFALLRPELSAKPIVSGSIPYRGQLPLVNACIGDVRQQGEFVPKIAYVRRERIERVGTTGAEVFKARRQCFGPVADSFQTGTR